MLCSYHYLHHILPSPPRTYSVTTNLIMVSLAAVKAGNAALLSTLPTGFTGVFLGATSGIGLHALKQLAIITAEKAPHIYIIGRSAVNAAPLLDELRQSNVSAKFIFIEKDISLVRSVDDVVAEIRRHEEKVDLLFMSPGFISFHGRKGM